jgi:hypothetical protein
MDKKYLILQKENGKFVIKIKKTFLFWSWYRYEKGNIEYDTVGEAMNSISFNYLDDNSFLQNDGLYPISKIIKILSVKSKNQNK